jgi:AcrR family transcriptional regulator
VGRTEGAGQAISRRERQALRTRESIVAAARELFDAHGYNETTIDEIAERAEIAPRTFFRYFEAKEALLFADREADEHELIEALRARPAEEHPARAVAEALRSLVPSIVHRREDLAWGLRMSEEHEVIGAYERAVLRPRMTDSVAAVVAGRLGVDDSDPRPELWARSLLGSFGAAIKLAVQSERLDELEPMFDEQLHALGDALEHAVRRTDP